MAFEDLLYNLERYSLFENPEVLAVAVGFLALIIVIYVLKNYMEKSVAIIVGVVLGLITGWGLYRGDFYGWENTMGILLYIVIGLLFLKILVWPFIKRFSRH